MFSTLFLVFLKILIELILHNISNTSSFITLVDILLRKVMLFIKLESFLHLEEVEEDKRRFFFKESDLVKTEYTLDIDSLAKAFFHNLDL
jgi:hypothetical protein